jgi:hypothetical protein
MLVFEAERRIVSYPTLPTAMRDSVLTYLVLLESRWVLSLCAALGVV